MGLNVEQVPTLHVNTEQPLKSLLAQIFSSQFVPRNTRLFVGRPSPLQASENC